MKLPSWKFIAINLASLMIVAAAAATQFQAYFNPPTMPSCTARYTRAVQFGTEHAGVLLTSIDVQASSNGADVGVMENLSLQRFKDGPAKSGLAVALAAGSAQPDSKDGKGGGVSFPWSPRAIPEMLTAACLSFNVFLPADFNFGGGGSLPGLFGVSPAEGLAQDENFKTHAVWSGAGRPMNHMHLFSTEKPITEYTWEDPRDPLPRGRWFRIDQEVVLNTPKMDDGKVRIWIDGSMRGESTGANLRSSADVSIRGVIADVHFGGQVHRKETGVGRAVKNEQIYLTPFVLRWN
jgi:hypothetical protein